MVLSFPLYPIPSFLAKFSCILLVQFFPQRASDNGECFPLAECSTTPKLTKTNSISPASSGQWLYSCRWTNVETTTILTIYIQMHCSHNWLNNIASSELLSFLRPKPYLVISILSIHCIKCCTHAFLWVASEEGSRPIVGPVHRQHEQELVVPWLRERHEQINDLYFTAWDTFQSINIKSWGTGAVLAAQTNTATTITRTWST